MERLADFFPPERISWRVGSTTKDKTKGLALAYIDARDVMQRLDDVMGPANWSDSYRDDNGTTMCALSLRIDGEWITKEDGSGDTDVEAEKGAVSKALVRAAVKWGIGRYLYDLDSPWVAIEPMGRSFKIAKNEYARLNKCLPNPSGDAEKPLPRASVQTEDRLDWSDLIDVPPGTVSRNAAQSREAFKALREALNFAQAPDELVAWAEANAGEIYSLSPEARHHLREAYDTRIETIIEERSAA